MGYRKAAKMRRRQYVGGHYRTSKNGNTYWVSGHMRNDDPDFDLAPFRWGLDIRWGLVWAIFFAPLTLGLSFVPWVVHQVRKLKKLKYGEKLLQEYGEHSSEGALLRAWLNKRMKSLGYDPKDPPQYLKKALETGNPKDLPVLTYGEWSSFNRARNNANAQAGYEYGHPGETSEERNARIQRNIDANTKWVRENAWKYKN